MATSIQAANRIIALNPGLQKEIRLRRQKQVYAQFKHVILAGEYFHLTVCNHPFHRFHRSAEEAAAVTARKNHHPGLSPDQGLNFSGKYHKLWCEGGEAVFIANMIRESQEFSKQVAWFTKLVSKGRHLASLSQQLRAQGCR